MSRARNDRNIIRFGPKPASLESEIRRVRREIDAETFELRQDIDELSITPPPAPVVPGDFNSSLAAGFPYLLNNLNDVYAFPSWYTQKSNKVGRQVGNITSPQGIIIAGSQNVHYVDFPDGAVTSVLVESIATPITVGGRLIAPTGDISAPARVYDFASGTQVDLVIDDLQFMRDEWEDYFSDLWENQQFGPIFQRTRRMDVATLSGDDGGFYLPRIVSIRPNSDARQIVYGAYHRFDIDTLERQDVYFGLANTQLEADSLDSSFANAVGSSGMFYTSVGRTFQSSGLRRMYSFDTSGNLGVVSLTSSTEYPMHTVDKGFVDDLGRLVCLKYNTASGLWEIHLLSSSGVRSILPLVFSGNPDDQPNTLTPITSDPYFRNDVTPSTIPGIAAGPDGGYFVYGNFTVNLGEVHNGGPVVVGIPAIWYVTSAGSQRVWTLQDSADTPLQFLDGGISTFSHAGGVVSVPNSATLSGRRLAPTVSHLRYSPDLGQVDFLVRVGTSYVTGVDSATVTGSKSVLYRVQL